MMQVNSLSLKTIYMINDETIYMINDDVHYQEAQTFETEES